MIKLIAPLVFLCLSTQIFAQNSKSEIGLELGPSRTKIVDSWIGEYNKAKLGYYIGLSYQYNLSERFSVRTGLAFEQKGSRQDRQLSFADSAGNFTYDQLKVKESYSYITIPVLLRVNFGKKIKYFVNAGPYAGLLISYKYKREQGKLLQAFSGGDTEGLNQIDLGISAGAGIQYPFSNKISASLEVRHNAGLLSIYGPDLYFTGIPPSVLTNATNILVGLSFNLGNKNKTDKQEK